ncbi:hypothetical protein ACJJI3_01415 [Microbulbifer sp. ZKSA004]|uniref:hypothetical protein n=1 Tax=Microbulbifer sp. ZKSA004 TaxID=3243389 RepID=UPI004039941C
MAEQVTTHAELVNRAEHWLKSQGCGVVFRDEFRATTYTGEQPDAIGWRDGLSLLIECKASRSDFLADKRKKFRQDPAQGMGDWRFYMCPPDVIREEDLPEGWGLLYALPRQIKKVHGCPGNCDWWNKKPFEGHKRAETQMMYSALRRMEVRGHLKGIYEGDPRYA